MIISEMQDKLARWSLADKERKFDRLLRLKCYGYEPLLNGELHALKGARVVRRGETGK